MSSKYPLATIGKVCSVGDGAHAKVKRLTSGILYLTSKNIGNGYLKLENVDYISQEDYEKLFSKNSKAVRRPHIGDVLIGIIGTFGNAYKYKEKDNFGVSSSIAILRPNQSVLNPDFLYYVVTSESFKQVHLGHQGGSVQGYTNIPTIKCLPIAIPPLSEQKAIAHILGTLDGKIELNQQTNQTLEAMAKAIFKSWFVDFDPVKAKMEGRQPIGMDAATAELFPDSFEESALGLIPKGWRVGKLDDLLVLQRGFDLPKSKRIFGRYPIIAASGFSDNHIEYKVKGPGVTTGRSGVLGNVFYIHDDFWPLNTSLWVKEFRIAQPIYTYHFLRLLELETFNAGSAVPTLNRNHIHGLPSIIPSKLIIQKFENLIRPMFCKCYQNDKESGTLVNIRDILLPKLISGEIRVREAERILEEVA